MPYIPAYTQFRVFPHAPFHDFSYMLESLTVLLQLVATQCQVVLQFWLLQLG